MSGLVKRIRAGADGIYVSYFSGVTGTSLAMFTFVDGTITGADASGAAYDGHYEVSEEGNRLNGVVSIVLGPYETSITGFSVGEQELRYDVPIELPIELPEDEIFRIETPIYFTRHRSAPARTPANRPAPSDAPRDTGPPGAATASPPLPRIAVPAAVVHETADAVAARDASGRPRRARLHGPACRRIS